MSAGAFLTGRVQQLPSWFYSYGGGEWTTDPPDNTAAGYLIDGLDTTGPGGSGFEDIDDAAIFRYRLLPGGRARPPMSGFDIRPNFPAGSVAVYAVVLHPVPEPAALGAVALAAGLTLLRRRR